MFDTVFGLPVHVLVLHFAVVGVPVAAVATAAVALRPSWRARFGWWAAGLDAAVVVLVWVTKESGEKLVGRVFPDAAERPAAMRTHIERGSDLVWYTVGMFVAAVLLAALARRTARSAAQIRKPVPDWAVGLVTVLVVVAAALTTVQVVRAGHAGSQVTWKPVVDNTVSQG